VRSKRGKELICCKFSLSEVTRERVYWNWCKKCWEKSSKNGRE